MNIEEMMERRRLRGQAPYTGGGPHPAALLVGVRVVANPAPDIPEKRAIFRPSRPHPEAISTIALPRARKNETSRQLALRIFGNHCFFCGHIFRKNEDPPVRTFDHFIPWSIGKLHKGNLVPACFRCNNKKADRLPTQEERDKFQAAVLRAES